MTHEFVDLARNAAENLERYKTLLYCCVGAGIPFSLLVYTLIRQNRQFHEMQQEAQMNLVADEFGECVAIRAKEQGTLKQANRAAMASIMERHQDQRGDSQ